jgi:hypothetical protein
MLPKSFLLLIVSIFLFTTVSATNFNVKQINYPDQITIGTNSTGFVKIGSDSDYNDLIDVSIIFQIGENKETTIPFFATFQNGLREFTKDFNYQPLSVGTYLIRVKINTPDDNLSDNFLEKTLIVKQQDVNQPIVNTQWVIVRDNCLVIFSNGDKLFSKGMFDINGQEGKFSWSFDFQNQYGASYFQDTNSIEGKNYAGGNRSMQVNSITGNVASAIILFPENVTTASSNCGIDIKTLSSDFQIAQDKLAFCQTNLTSTTANYQALEDAKNANLVTLATAQEGLSLCQNEKSSLSTNLSLAGNSCDARVSQRTDELNGSCTAQKQSMRAEMDSKDTQISQAKNMTLMATLVAFGLALLCCGILYMVKKGVIS